MLYKFGVPVVLKAFKVWWKQRLLVHFLKGKALNINLDERQEQEI